MIADTFFISFIVKSVIYNYLQYVHQIKNIESLDSKTSSGQAVTSMSSQLYRLTGVF